MQRYEIATLTTTLGAAAKAAPAIEAFSHEGGGTLLGCWTTELGPLNQIVVLRGFGTPADFASERERTLLSGSPFGGAEWLTGMSLDGYAPFPGLPAVTPGSFGPIYEIRSYVLKTGGLQPTLDAWAVAVPPRAAVSPLVIALYGLDGAPRITHIWPYRSLEQRTALRARAVAEGIWPPKGGPAWLSSDMRSTIGLPTAVSPLR